jgi:hypothetical protein
MERKGTMIKVTIEDETEKETFEADLLAGMALKRESEGKDVLTRFACGKGIRENIISSVPHLAVLLINQVESDEIERIIAMSYVIEGMKKEIGKNIDKLDDPMKRAVTQALKNRGY